MDTMVTVITVCYNEAKNIASTIRSVLGQTYGPFEYIVKDGGSTDGTLEILDSFKEGFKKQGLEYRIIEGKDKGLYEAMNQAAAAAKGDWVIFMNAGDRFFSSKTLFNIFGTGKSYEGCDILYGDAAEEEYGELYLFRKCPDQILHRMPYSHQSVFARRELLRRFPFDTSYKIGADYHFLLRAYLDGARSLDTGEIVARVTKDGVSSVRLKDTFLETVRIRADLGVPQSEDRIDFKKRLSINLRQLGMDYLPDSCKYWIRKAQRKMRGQMRVQPPGNEKNQAWVQPPGNARSQIRPHSPGNARSQICPHPPINAKGQKVAAYRQAPPMTSSIIWFKRMARYLLMDLASAPYRGLIYPIVRLGLSLRTGSILRKGSFVKNAVLKGRNYLGERTQFRNGTLGFGSYINRDGDFTGAKIGKYCSIGSEVHTAVGSHPIDGKTPMHPAFTNPDPIFGFSYVKEKTFDDTPKGIEIGDNVWIGDRVTILDGVRIGDNAVVGAGAVVTKDLPKNSVNVGVPARQIARKNPRQGT